MLKIWKQFLNEEENEFYTICAPAWSVHFYVSPVVPYWDLFPNGFIFSSKIEIFLQKSKFWSKIEILDKNRSFGRKSKFWTKIEVLVENRNLCSRWSVHFYVSPVVRTTFSHRFRLAKFRILRDCEIWIFSSGLVFRISLQIFSAAEWSVCIKCVKICILISCGWSTGSTRFL